VADALRPALAGLAGRVIAAVQETVPAYEGALDPNVRQGVDQALEGLLELVASGEGAQLPGRQVYISFGRAEARSGRSLEALLAAYRAGARVAWRGFAEAGDRAGLEPRTLYTLAEAVFAYIDEISAASAEGFAQQQSAAAGERHERRRRLLELLLREPHADTATVKQAAQAAQWDLPDRLAALAFDAPDPDRLARRVRSPVLAAGLDGVSWALVADPDGPGRRAELEAALRGGPAALGPTVPWREAAESARRAKLALVLAQQSHAGLVVADERLLDLLLLRDPALAAELARRRLEPLESLPTATRQRLRATLEAWLDAQGHARTAAERLHVHVQTLRYRLGQLREILGEALDDPQCRLELALALRIDPGRAHEPSRSSPGESTTPR
jgi:PucR C-terminal helix-turn-helix domain